MKRTYHRRFQAVWFRKAETAFSPYEIASHQKTVEIRERILRGLFRRARVAKEDSAMEKARKTKSECVAT